MGWSGARATYFPWRRCTVMTLKPAPESGEGERETEGGRATARPEGWRFFQKFAAGSLTLPYHSENSSESTPPFSTNTWTKETTQT